MFYNTTKIMLILNSFCIERFEVETFECQTLTTFLKGKGASLLECSNVYRGICEGKVKNTNEIFFKGLLSIVISQ